MASGVPLPRAFLRVGGASIARHQLAQALSLECQRIICIARGINADLIEMQHVAERAGAAFHVLSGPRALIGQVTANDDVFVFLDGLLANPAFVSQQKDSGAFVMVQPIEIGLEQGFERVDLNHSAAGLMRIPGRLIERLADLPSDCDVGSALMRIGLQSGIAARPLPDVAREDGGWRIIRDEAEAQACESAWIARYLQRERAHGPGMWLTRLGITALGPALLHGGYGGRTLSYAAIATLALAFASAWLDWIAVGFLLCGLAWIFVRGMAILGRIENAGVDRAAAGSTSEKVLTWLVDVMIVFIAISHAPMMPWETWVSRAFPPLALIGVLRMFAAIGETRWMAWVQDRSVLCVGLALCAIAAVLPDGFAVMTLLLLAAGIVFLKRGTRIT